MPDDSRERFGLKPGTIDRINAVFAAHPQIEQALLYGSRAMDSHRPASDIDLTLVGETLTLSQLLNIADEIDELLLPYKIDLSLHHAIDNPQLLEHIRRVGKVFYTRRRN